MPNREQMLERYLANSENPYHELLNEFALYLREQPTKRNIARSYNTDYNNIIQVNKFLNYINGNIAELSISILDKFLEGYQAKNDIYSKLKHFITFLYKTNRTTEELYKKSIDRKYKNGLNGLHAKNKKFAIPMKHWKAVYSQLSGVKKFAILLLFHSGIRVGELINGEISDLEFKKEENRYYYHVKPKYDSKGNLLWYPKTDKSERLIPLDPSCNDWINAFLEIRKSYNFGHNYLLYITKDKKNIYKRGDKIRYESNVHTWMKKIVYDTPQEEYKPCKVMVKRTTRSNKGKFWNQPVICTYDKAHRHISPHITRYSYASHIYYIGRDKGVDLLDEVSKLLGHTNSKTTYTYLQLDKATENERKIKAVDMAFGGK